MKKEYSSDTLGLFCIIGAGVGFSLKALFVKLTFAYGVSVDAMMLWRYSIAIVMFLVFLGWKDRCRSLILPKESSLFVLVVAGILGCYASTYADYRALELLDTGISRFILFTFPVFVVMMNAAIDRSFPPQKQIVAIMIIQIGLYAMLMHGNVFESINHEGVMWAVTAALIYAAYLVLVKRASNGISSVTLATYIVLVALLCNVINFTLLGRWDNELAITPMAGFWLFMTAFFSTFMPITLMAEGIRRIGSSRASLISSFGPFLSVVLGYVFLDEMMSPMQWIGGVIIFLGVVQLEKKISVKRLFRRAI